MAGGRIAASELNIATALADGDRVMIIRANGKTETIDASLLIGNGEGGIPVPGPPGKDGAPGRDGKDAVNPNFNVNVTTLEPGSSATATITGTYPNLTINLGIPRGADGEGGGIGPEPPLGEKMYYGRLSVGEVGGSVVQYSSITESMIKTGTNIIESEPKTLGKTSLGREADTLMGDYLIVAVPTSKGYTVTKDNGFGGKVPFNEDDAGANGVSIGINGINYKLYGEILLSPAEIFIYID